MRLLISVASCTSYVRTCWLKESGRIGARKWVGWGERRKRRKERKGRRKGRGRAGGGGGEREGRGGRGGRR